MAFLHVPNVAIKGISACVPSIVEENADYPLNSEDITKLISSTGIERKRVADSDVCTSDLCFKAAERLIEGLKWDKDEIDCLIFVTQTPDYIFPATACILQDRLGLSEECYTLDISLGCSGYVYGLSVIASLLANGNLKKGLLLVGDTLSKVCSKQDKSTWPLFGDAGSATALEYSEGADGFYFHLASDGQGKDAIIIKDGGYRNQVTEQSLREVEYEKGITRSSLNLSLDGMDVFSFAVSKVPQSIKKLMQYCSEETIDYYIFHQANLLLNETIRKKLKLNKEAVPYSLRNFGNTSSTTIPLTIVTEIRERVICENLNLIGCGFGVGLSWGSVYFKTNRIVCPQLIVY